MDESQTGKDIESFDIKDWLAHQWSLKNMRDYNNTINTAREDALAKGLAEGLAKGLTEGEIRKARSIAKSLIEMRMDTAKIAQISGLTIEEIKSL